MALEPAGEVELEQHDVDLSCGNTGRANQLVDIHGAGSESANDLLALALANLRQGLGRPIFVRCCKLDR